MGRAAKAVGKFCFDALVGVTDRQARQIYLAIVVWVVGVWLEVVLTCDEPRTMQPETANPPRPPRTCNKCDPPHETTDYYVTHIGIECAVSYENRMRREACQEPAPRRESDAL